MVPHSLDRGTIIADITDVQEALNMEDATGEIVGYFKSGYYNDELAKKTVIDFNGKYHIPGDEFSPVMKSLKEQNNMGVLVDYASGLFEAMIAVFLCGNVDCSMERRSSGRTEAIWRIRHETGNRRRERTCLQDFNL